MANPILALAHPVIGVRDLDRALAFYCDLLEFSGVDVVNTGDREQRVVTDVAGNRLVLELVAGDLRSDWVQKSQQLGIRHVGLKVDDVDRWAEALHDAGTPFTIEPLDAFGGVRVAFFLDPDGTHLEVVQGFVEYTAEFSVEEIAIERERGLPATPRIDHIAITVSDLDSALDFYGKQCGFRRYAELAEPGEPRGMRLNYLSTSAVTLEIFSFVAPTYPNPANLDGDNAGLSRLGVEVSDTAAALAEFGRASICLTRSVGAAIVLPDPDGTPIELVVS